MHLAKKPNPYKTEPISIGKKMSLCRSCNYNLWISKENNYIVYLQNFMVITKQQNLPLFKCMYFQCKTSQVTTGFHTTCDSSVWFLPKLSASDFWITSSLVQYFKTRCCDGEREQSTDTHWQWQ